MRVSDSSRPKIVLLNSTKNTVYSLDDTNKIVATWMISFFQSHKFNAKLTINFWPTKIQAHNFTDERFRKRLGDMKVLVLQIL